MSSPAATSPWKPRPPSSAPTSSLDVFQIPDYACTVIITAARPDTQTMIHAVLGEAATSGVTIQMLPFGSGAHAGVNGKFTFLEFPDNPPVAYVEGRIHPAHHDTREGEHVTRHDGTARTPWRRSAYCDTGQCIEVTVTTFGYAAVAR